jgi:hypothetical protein
MLQLKHKKLTREPAAQKRASFQQAFRRDAVAFTTAAIACF